MKMRKAGLWNWMPQPTACPPALSATSAPARTRNDTTIPAAEARKFARTVARAAPPWLTTLSSLIDSTGSTHGIRLRMRPPSSASASTPSSPPADAAAPCATVSARSVARSPSTRVNVTVLPASVSPGTAPTGTRSTACRPPSLNEAVGLPKLQLLGPSTNKSGAANGVSARADTDRNGDAPRWNAACSMATPPPSPGTRATKRSIRCACALGTAGPARSARASCVS